VTENPTPADASEEAISANDLVEYVVKQVKKNPKAYAIGGAVVAFLVVKKFRGGKEATKTIENFSPGTIRLFGGPFGTDTFELSVMLKGDELRQAMDKVGLSVVKK
jgi:hypothetical protein